MTLDGLDIIFKVTLTSLNFEDQYCTKVFENWYSINLKKNYFLFCQIEKRIDQQSSTKKKDNATKLWNKTKTIFFLLGTIQLCFWVFGQRRIYRGGLLPHWNKRWLHNFWWIQVMLIDLYIPKIRQLPTSHSRPTFMRLTAKLYSLMRSFEICSLWTSEMLILLPTILTLWKKV